MADLYTHSYSDNIRLAKSKRLVGLGDGTYNIIRIPRFTLVKNAVLWVPTVLVGNTVTVGFIGNGESADEDYFLKATEAEASEVGYKTSTRAKYFDASSGAITFTVSSIGDGVCFVFVDYSVVY